MRTRVGDIRDFDFGGVQTLVFAGGGNRCWWQAGALAHLLEQGARLPRQLVGTSAGAAVAASFLADGVDTALQACLRLFAANPKVFDWGGLPKLRLRFAHQQVYPAWVDAFLNTDTFTTLRQASSRLTVALTPRYRAGRVSATVRHVHHATPGILASYRRAHAASAIPGREWIGGGGNLRLPGRQIPVEQHPPTDAGMAGPAPGFHGAE